MKKLLAVLWFFTCFTLLFSSTACAYIDPSAMTYVIQIVVSVVIAVSAAFGFYFRRIRRALSKLRKRDVQDDWEDDDEDDDNTGFDDYELPGMASAPVQAAPVQAAPQADAAQAQIEPAIYEALPQDKYDETGGLSALAAENRELRRQLAAEREKVRVLIKALNIIGDN